MAEQKETNVVGSVVSAFFIGAGGSSLVGLLAGNGHLNANSLIALLVLGVVTAAKDYRSLKALPPVKADPADTNLTKVLGLLALGSLLLFLSGCFSGCAYVRVYDKDKQVGFSSMMPAWPWQDSTAVIERVQFSSKSNAFTASVRGLNENETTSTNAANMIEAVSKGAIEGAVKALAK